MTWLLKTIMRRFFIISVVLLLACTVKGFSKDFHVSAFPVAIFSPDGTSVYYVQFDLRANVRKTGGFCRIYARTREICIISEAVSIHKLSLATGKNDSIATLPRPPWVRPGEWRPRTYWFDGEAATMWWLPGGDLPLEVHGPRTSAISLQGLREMRQAIFVSSGPEWTDSPIDNPRPTLWTELKYVVSGSVELVSRSCYSDDVSCCLVALDHDRKTSRLLATGSDRGRKLPSFRYKDMLFYSRLKGPVTDLEDFFDSGVVLQSGVPSF